MSAKPGLFAPFASPTMRFSVPTSRPNHAWPGLSLSQLGLIQFLPSTKLPPPLALLPPVLKYIAL